MSQPHAPNGPEGADAESLHVTERALSLIERIHRAIRSPVAWTGVAEAVGREFGDAAVAISLGLPDDAMARALYSYGLDPEYAGTHGSAALSGFPWELPEAALLLHRGFVVVGDLFPGVDLASNTYVRGWMAPQGLAPVWPMVHFIAMEGSVALAAMAIFRRGSTRPFTASDVELANLLVPHLRRAYRLFVGLGGVRQQRLALAEVMDRLSTGIFLIDAQKRATATNLSARRIAGENDGLSLERGALRAVHRAENRMLDEMLTRVVSSTSSSSPPTGLLALSRPSGRRPLTLYATPLLDPRSPTDHRAAVAVVFVADPEGGGIGGSEALRRVYDLTEAEAELVSLLVEGRRLEEAARLRGVSRNTAKTQLSRVFEKTGVRRQADLVRLVLTGMPGGRAT